MPQEAPKLDLIGLTRALGEAEDVETTMSFFGPAPVWDGSPLGLEIYEGRDAIRRSLEEWVEI
jgi:hypothetical protein